MEARRPSRTESHRHCLRDTPCSNAILPPGRMRGRARVRDIVAGRRADRAKRGERVHCCVVNVARYARNGGGKTVNTTVYMVARGTIRKTASVIQARYPSGSSIV